MKKSTYIKINGKEYDVIVSRKARNNAALNFFDNICFVLEASEHQLVEDKVFSIRNAAFGYDMLVLLSSETDDAIIIGFADIEDYHRIDIDFNLAA